MAIVEKFKVDNGGTTETVEQLQLRIASLEGQLANAQTETQRLNESHARLSQIMDSLPVMIGYVDLNQRIVLANKHIERWYQLSREELVGMQLKELFSDEHYQTVETLLDQVLSGNEVNGESVITYPDGVRRYVHLNYIPDFQQGEVFGYYFLVRDISERKKVEKQLHQHQQNLGKRIERATEELQYSNRELRDEIRTRTLVEEKLRASQVLLSEALESMTDGFLLFDEDGYLVIFNSRVRDLFPSLGDALKPGARFEHLIRLSAEAGDVKEAEGRVDEWVSQRMANYPSTKGTVEVQLADGTWILATDRPTSNNGVVSLRTDISDRKNAQEKIRLQQEQMSSVMRRASMGEMASALAHEMSQPLAAINNYCNGSLRRLQRSPENMSEVIEALEKASLEAERAKSIIRHVSDFVRQSIPVVCECRMHELVQIVFELSEASLKRNAIRCTLDLPAQGVVMMVNRIEVEQVLFNLIRNSIDALKSVALTNRRILVKGAVLADQGCQISVTDNGPGIADHVRDQIFEPYITTKQSGLGMGLSISRTIVESHGGRLWVDGSMRSGSRVIFSIPESWAEVDQHD